MRGVLDVVGFILRCRRVADMSQRDLARVLGVCASTVARWETGEREPVASMLGRIARVAGLELTLTIPSTSSASSDELADASAGEAPSDGEPRDGQLRVRELRDGESAGPGRGAGPGASGEWVQKVAAWPEDTERDALGRRWPAHLDVFLTSREESPTRYYWTDWRHIHVPYRAGRDRLRAWVPWYDPEEVPEVRGPLVVRRLRETLTRADHRAWLITLKRSYREYQERRAAFLRSLPGYVEEPDCQCEVECHEAITCVESCECRCEVEGSRIVA